MANFAVIPGSTLDILRRYAAPANANQNLDDALFALDSYLKPAPAVNTPSFSERLAASQSPVPGSTVIPGSVLYPSEADPTAPTVTGSPYLDRAAMWFQDTFEKPINRVLNTSNAIGDTLGLAARGAIEFPYKYFTATPEERAKTKDQYLKELSEAASLFNNGYSRDWQGRNFDTAVNLVTLGAGGGSVANSIRKGVGQLAKSAGQKNLAETFYKNAGELAARNAAGDFPTTAAGVSKLTKQYVTQGKRALTEAEKLATQGNSAIKQAAKAAGGTAIGIGGANAIDAANDKTPAATNDQIKTVEQNITNNLVAQAAGQDSPAVNAIKLSNPVSADQLRAAGIPDITPAIINPSATPQTSSAQNLLRLISQMPPRSAMTESGVPISAAQAAQEYQQALRDRNAQGLTREDLLRQAMDKRQQALSRINAERESSPLAWLGHIVSLLSAWRRREFNPSATWSNATLAQAALDPEYQEAEDTIRLLAPQYATSQQNLEKAQKSAFNLADLASRDARTAAIQQAADASEQRAQAQVFRAMNAASSTDPLAKLSNDQLDIYENTLKKALAAAKSEAVRKQITAKLAAIQSTRENRIQ
nr:MAG TPA: hypothetical protein [Caudoviricetes sp.]